MSDILKETDSVKLEKCVICGSETPYTENTHIDYRNFYVEGCGQLCGECYNKVHDNKSNDQIILG